MMWRRVGVLLLIWLGSVHAQTPPPAGTNGAEGGPPAADPAATASRTPGTAPATPPAAPGRSAASMPGAGDSSRQTATAGFMSPAMMVHRSWLLVQAAQIRDYCDTPRVAPERLQRILERFSRYSGQPEDCQTVRKY